MLFFFSFSTICWSNNFQSWNPVFSQIAFRTLVRSPPFKVLPKPSWTENEAILVFAKNSCGGTLTLPSPCKSPSSVSARRLSLYSSFNIFDQSGILTGNDAGVPPVESARLVGFLFTRELETVGLRGNSDEWSELLKKSDSSNSKDDDSVAGPK